MPRMSKHTKTSEQNKILLVLFVPLPNDSARNKFLCCRVLSLLNAVSFFRPQTVDDAHNTNKLIK